MPINWTSLTPEQLAIEASLHASDHEEEEENSAFFDVELATWSLTHIAPATLNVFKDSDEARSWIYDEINFFKADGNIGRAKMYEDMLNSGIQDPVIIGQKSMNFSLWDGFHRVAIAMARKELVLVILGVYKQ